MLLCDIPQNIRGGHSRDDYRHGMTIVIVAWRYACRHVWSWSYYYRRWEIGERAFFRQKFALVTNPLDFYNSCAVPGGLVAFSNFTVPHTHDLWVFFGKICEKSIQRCASHGSGGWVPHLVRNCARLPHLKLRLLGIDQTDLSPHSNNESRSSVGSQIVQQFAIVEHGRWSWILEEWPIIML